MPEKKTTSLSEVVKLYSSEGANDRKWILAEHQLAQAKMSIQIARETLKDIEELPENDDERGVADVCLNLTHRMNLDFLACYTTFLSYLASTNASDRIGRKEL